jgi:hypothetical protein
VRFASLRSRLFAAIALVALLSLALALLLGALVTRRAVERNSLRDVSAQFDLLVERERDAILPFARLDSLQEFLDPQDERTARRSSAAARGWTARSRPTAPATSTRPASSTARASCSCGRRVRRAPPGGRTSRA